jgi:hypothetical protein
MTGVGSERREDRLKARCAEATIVHDVTMSRYYIFLVNIVIIESTINKEATIGK